MRTSKIAVALVAALSIGFVGCSGDDTSSPSTSTSTGGSSSGAPTQATTSQPNTTVTSTTQVTESSVPDGDMDAATLAKLLGTGMGSLKYVGVTSDMLTDLGEGGAPIQVISNMHIDFTDPKETRASGTIAQSGMTYEVVLIGQKVYMKSAGEAWQEVPSEYTSSNSVQSNYSESYWNQVLLGEVIKVGAETVDGIATTHFRATGGESEGMVIDSFDIWVDAQWRCVKGELRSALWSEAATLTTSNTFYDFDVPVEITAPI